MSKVTATGKRRGMPQTFEATIVDGELHVECKTKDLTAEQKKYLKEIFMLHVEHAPPIAGTYYPPENTLTAAVCGFENGFFDDDDVQIDIEGELEPIPYEEGRIY